MVEPFIINFQHFRAQDLSRHSPDANKQKLFLLWNRERERYSFITVINMRSSFEFNKAGKKSAISREGRIIVILGNYTNFILFYFVIFLFVQIYLEVI